MDSSVTQVLVAYVREILRYDTDESDVVKLHYKKLGLDNEGLCTSRRVSVGQYTHIDVILIVP